MRNKLNRGITKAVNVLEKVPIKEIQQLSLVESACALEALSDTTDLVELRDVLVRRAQDQLYPEWISEGDLFEVFLVFNALWKRDPAYISGECLSNVVQRLVRCEAKVGGPYYSGDTIEIAANLQILSFVRRVAKSLPGVESFLNHAIATGRFEDAIDTQPYVLYLLSSTPDYLNALQKCTAKYQQTIGYKAIMLTATQDQSEAENLVNEICDAQDPTGFWRSNSPFGNLTVSSIVKTALVGGILTRYRRRLVAASPSQLSAQHQAVVKTAKQLVNMHDEPLRTLTLSAIDAVCFADKGYEITLLPYFFARSLKDRSYLSDQQCNLLGAANLYGWVAYTIYDDFLDNEGMPAQLPVANCAMRYALNCFQAAIPAHQRYQRYVSRVFTKMDAANAWEIANCRFIVHGNTVTTTRLPQYQQCAVLASRSFAHALGPMAVLVQHSKGNQKNIDHLESAFRHYLIARQLADDLCDWADDMQTGRVSYVVAAILRNMRLPPGEYSLDTLLLDMRKAFRRTTMTRVCSLALHHTQKARLRFVQYGLMSTTDDIFTLLDTLERILKSSADDHAKTTAFARGRR